MDSIQSVIQGSYDGILAISLRECILYLEKQFGRRFVVEVSCSEGYFSHLMKMPIEIEDEMRLRFAYRIGKILVDAYGKKVAKRWFFGDNHLLGFCIPLYSLGYARSMNTLKEVLMAAEAFVSRKNDDGNRSVDEQENGNDIEEQIEQEVAERSWGKCFLPDAWRRFRRMGYKPEEIRYDLCHGFW